MDKRFLVTLFCIILSSACNGKTIKKEGITKTSKKDTLIISELIQKQEFSELEKAIEYGLADNYIYNGEPLLSYFVSNNFTDLSISLLNRTKDLRYIDEQIDVSLFSTVIYKKNLILERAFLEKGVDLTYRDTKRGNASYLDMILGLENNAERLSIMEIFCDFEYVKVYFQNNPDTLLSISRKWSDQSPHYIELIYGEDFTVPDNLPVLHWNISNLDALKYFVERGADTKHYFYGDYCGTALDYAIESRDILKQTEVDMYLEDWKEQQLDTFNTIIEYLETQ